MMGLVILLPRWLASQVGRERHDFGGGAGHCSIAVWSPGLDRNGNSYIGTQMLEYVTNEMDWTVFS